MTIVAEHYSLSRELATKLLEDCRVSGYIFCLGDAGKPFSDTDTLSFSKARHPPFWALTYQFTPGDLVSLAEELEVELKKLQQLGTLGSLLPKKVEVP